MTAQESRLDLERRQRLGMVEAVWGEHKSVDQIVAILPVSYTHLTLPTTLTV